MNYKNELEQIIEYLTRFPKFNEFIEINSITNPLDSLIDRYKEFLLAKGELTEETSIQLAILQEKYASIAEQTLGIHYLNKHLIRHQQQIS